MSAADLFQGGWGTLRSVAAAILPLVLLFLILQVLMLRLPRRYVLRILKGTLVAAAGLLLFLQGVQISFLPFGQAIGAALGTLPHRWLLFPFGALLGFFTAWGEPSVRVLADQVEEASGGAIPRRAVLYAVCIGTSLIVGLGMLRIAFDIPLLHLLVPGYLLVLGLLWFSDEAFLAIAIDAGGVATGPLANSFLLALALGTAASLGGRDPILHGLGLVALIALAPILSVMALGFLFAFKKRRGS